jgi:seryl-tRNA synthetase
LSFTQQNYFLWQKKEAVGDDDSLPETVSQNLTELTKETMEPLTVTQLKKIRALIDEAMVKNNEDLVAHETAR